MSGQVLTGGCFCGAITYEISGALAHARCCHCSRCRKAFSGAGSAYAEFSEGAEFRWTSGEETLTRMVSEEGWGMAFCSKCGSTLCGIWQDQVHGITLGCVDGDPGVEIEHHLFVDSRAPWDHIGGTAPQYAEHPPD